jgi:hypothetical protein
VVPWARGKDYIKALLETSYYYSNKIVGNLVIDDDMSGSVLFMVVYVTGFEAMVYEFDFDVSAKSVKTLKDPLKKYVIKL